MPDELAPSADVTVPGRLRLRRATPHDLEVVYAIHSDPRTNIHNPAGPDRDRRASQARLTEWLEHWEEHEFGYQVVELTDLPMSVIGFTGVRRSTWSDVPVLNLYYRYAADHHGHGYATEGARHVVAWAAARYPATPVVAITTLDNTGSQRTAEAAGLAHRPRHSWSTCGVGGGRSSSPRIGRPPRRSRIPIGTGSGAVSRWP